MEKLEEILQSWQQLAPQMVAVDIIRTDASLQPRDDRLIPFKDRHKVETASQDHVARMHAALDAGRDQQLEPLLVASYEGNLHLVDGHHRLKAYARAGRREIPVRVLPCTRHQAVMLSKLVNVGARTLAMDKEQARDACWQFIAHITNRGKRSIGDFGWSERKLAGRFGVARGTVQVMLAGVQSVTLEDFSSAALDPGTGWPRWKYVKDSAWKGGVDAMEPDEQLQWRAGKFAKQLAKLIDSADPAVRRLGIEMLTQESTDSAREDALSDVRRWSELHAQVTY